MSFRNTFVTDFIYSGNEEGIKASKQIAAIFAAHGIKPAISIDEGGMGYYAGIIRTLSLGLEDFSDYVKTLVYDLEKVTQVPFRLTVMQESGAVITWSIEPRKEK